LCEKRQSDNYHGSDEAESYFLIHGIPPEVPMDDLLNKYRAKSMPGKDAAWAAQPLRALSFTPLSRRQARTPGSIY
jgi:hypothetical protein